MFEEHELWYAVIDEEEHTKFPVKAGTEREHHGPYGANIKTYELHEESAVEGNAHLALIPEGTLEGGRERTIAKTRRGAHAAMLIHLDEEVY